MPRDKIAFIPARHGRRKHIASAIAAEARTILAIGGKRVRAY